MREVCLVTGGSGFVGRALLRRLAADYRLRLLVRQGRRRPWFDGLDCEIVAGELGDEAVLAEALRGVATVVHLAAIVSFRPEDRTEMFRVNADATAQLGRLALAAGVRRFLHVSTISAVGYSDDPVELDERAPYNFGPLRSGYSDSKHAAERHVLELVRQGLPAVLVNPPSMYGPGDRRKGDDSLLTAVLAGRVRLAPPGGINVANVEDVSDGICRAIDRGRVGERYILGGENLTGMQLLERIARIVGGRAPRRTVPRLAMLAAARLLRAKERLFGSRPPVTGEILSLAARHLWFSSDKAARELDWRAGPVDPGIAAAWRELRDA